MYKYLLNPLIIYIPADSTYTITGVPPVTAETRVLTATPMKVGVAPVVQKVGLIGSLVYGKWV
jgi:hypothetical protein